MIEFMTFFKKNIEIPLKSVVDTRYGTGTLHIMSAALR
jgi:hypothetical protein